MPAPARTPSITVSPLKISSRVSLAFAPPMRFSPPLPKISAESGGLDPLVWKITAVAVLGSFLSQLDAIIVNVSLSSLALDLHSSLTAIQWVTSGYLLALALMLPLNGWLVERIGAKSLYLWCFSAFTLSSALCAGLVRELVDRISHSPGHERRPDGSDDADDDGACCRKAYGAPHGLRGCANPDGADPWPGHRRCHSATRLLALALPGQRAGRCIGNRPGGSLSAQ